MADIVTTTLDTIMSTMPSDISDFRHQVLWVLIVGIIIAFILGAGMGGNDVANAFGTSVGSKVVTIIQAYILATIFETLGAVLVGASVTDTMRKGVVDTSHYEGEQKLFMLGQVAILGGCAAWLMIATVLHMPVSTTHSLVGATLGFSLVCKGFEGIRWMKIVNIVISWFLSPALSGLISSVLYLIVDFAVLRRTDPFECGMRALPVFYFVCITFNVFMVTYDGSKTIGLDKLSFWAAAGISVGFGVLAVLLTQFILKPRLRKTVGTPVKDITYGHQENSVSAVSIDRKEEAWKEEQAKRDVESNKKVTGVKSFFEWFLPDRNRTEAENTLKLFGVIQLFTACFAGFAHGANDVSNAIAPLSALIAIYKDYDVDQKESVPIYVILYGVLAICVGLWCLGHRVIKTVGTEMSEINPASGFTIEFGAAMTALLASKTGLPISTTHCLVGSVVAVGVVRTRDGVKWSIFRNIAISWIVTLPVAGLISAGIMALLKWLAM